MPVDCEVFQGRSTITIEHLTGEMKPVEMTVGERIPGGAHNLSGMMIVKVHSSMPQIFSKSASDLMILCQPTLRKYSIP